MKQSLLLLLMASMLGSCQKESKIKQISFPSFTASVNGTKVEFMSPVTAESITNSNGTYDLKIVGENRITNDSSTLIRFILPDFTMLGVRSANYVLNPGFNGNFIEWKSVPVSTQGKYHYFQSGQLSVEQDANKYLKGSFSFTYFLFDRQGNKTGEVQVANGSFSDVIIER
jgi:hypothetical protein